MTTGAASGAPSVGTAGSGTAGYGTALPGAAQEPARQSPAPRARRLLVTGAGAGIGAATAAVALRRGWEVAGLDLAGTPLAEAPRAGGADPAARPGPFPILQCDVADEDSVERAFAALDALWPEGPDAVVHCAGVYRVTPLTETSAAAWDGVLGVNARGSFLVAREAARRMRSGSGDRAIVLLSSIGAIRGDDHEPSAAYSSSKGAVSSLTGQLAAELGALGIRVNAVAPGVIDTAMTTLTDDPAAASAFFAQRVPLRREGTAPEVAEACVFLASPEAAYISGAVLPVDGGQSVL
ncbi:SDR family NAD(P)-dependent oxidoreductase [Leucobacter sp. PH1c]|uniref:SDR family NAD(P)-dependent oxidoreductase n=1 Tax=Leucobacter sp. PH1c TaxID=1397278 RepID=UPI0009DFD890|nr:SDR family oxidoreductase [Leucobacter sp. PH1c]